MINKKEAFILSITIFITVISWVVYDLLSIKYQSIIKENFSEILKTEAKINNEVINLLNEKEP